MAHQSDSDAQRDAEPLILAGVEAKLGVGLAPRSLSLEGGAPVEVDGVADDESVLVEIFAHLGPLKGGQRRKVALDALKLITLRRSRPDAGLIIAFGDKEAAAAVMGRSWLGEALRTWGIKVVVIDLDERMREQLLATQDSQSMVNRRLNHTPFDELLAAALPVAVKRLRVHADASSFRERYLEEALVEAIGTVAPAASEATGHGLVSIPNWDKKLGGFDLRIRFAGGSGAEALVETKIDDVEHTLWDLFKLAAGLTMPGIEAGYMVLARPSHRWDDGDCTALFAERDEPSRWDSAAMLEDWKAAWADLTGPRGGSARPTSIPSEVETAFIGRARAEGFDSYEIRCVAVRLVPGASLLRFEGDWPVSQAERG